MDLKELWERRKREKEEEAEYRRRRQKGEVSPEELSPREQRERVETSRRVQEEAAKAAAKARREEARRAPSVAREAMAAAEEAREAEERAKILETGLYGAPLQQPVEVIRDRWGREVERRPLAAKRRLEAAKLELAQKEITEEGLRLVGERYKIAGEEARERRVAKRRGKVMGPVTGIAKGVAGTVEAVGRGVSGIGFSPEPYRMTPPSVIPTLRPTRPVAPTRGVPTPQAPDLSALRHLQMQTPQIRPPGGQPRQPGKPKSRNTYNDHMRRMRRMLFGG